MCVYEEICYWWRWAIERGRNIHLWPCIPPLFLEATGHGQLLTGDAGIRTMGYTVYWFKTTVLTGLGNTAGIWQHQDIFLVVKMEEEALLSPGGRGQGCKTSPNAQDCHLQQRSIQPQVPGAPRLRHSDLKWKFQKEKSPYFSAMTSFYNTLFIFWQ